MQILIIGVGYVGLVTAACLAEMGNRVICYDIDEQKIEELGRGEIPIYEPGLKELVVKNNKEERLLFSSDFKKALKDSTICFISVPTPSNEDGSANLSYVYSVAKEIATHMEKYTIIVNRSTVPVGTAENVKELISDTLEKRGKEIPFDVVSMPEFLKEGSAISDCMKPDRIIIGSDSPKAIELLKKIYSAFSFNHDRILIMDIPSAEMTKYAANGMLATRISFMNELSRLCENLGADIKQVRLGMGSDSRIGYRFLYAGAGFGGSCLPKDLRALVSMYREIDDESLLMDAALKVNERQKNRLFEKIKDYFEDLKGKRIAIWGLSFKPDTDDIREAPSISLIKALHDEGVFLQLYDPAAIPNMKAFLKDYKRVSFLKNEYEAAHGCDAIALVTEWKQFRFLDFAKVIKSMRGQAFFDGRNQYNRGEMLEFGFEYYGIGMPDELSICSVV